MAAEEGYKGEQFVPSLFPLLSLLSLKKISILVSLICVCSISIRHYFDPSNARPGESVLRASIWVLEIIGAPPGGLALKIQLLWGFSSRMYSLGLLKHQSVDAWPIAINGNANADSTAKSKAKESKMDD